MVEFWVAAFTTLSFIFAVATTGIIVCCRCGKRLYGFAIAFILRLTVLVLLFADELDFPPRLYGLIGPVRLPIDNEDDAVFIKDDADDDDDDASLVLVLLVGVNADLAEVSVRKMWRLVV
mmetsp:Transcript_108/g.112  ORF Transcript_108/g.112 Transcript_108/m.112 type:complete len:120 (-) Transcript_108:364-723(-)